LNLDRVVYSFVDIEVSVNKTNNNKRRYSKSFLSARTNNSIAKPKEKIEKTVVSNKEMK